MLSTLGLKAQKLTYSEFKALASPYVLFYFSIFYLEIFAKVLFAHGGSDTDASSLYRKGCNCGFLSVLDAKNSTC